MSNTLPATRSPREQRQDLIAKALLGDAQSQCAMGELCRLGDEFTAQNYAEALWWFRLAAEQGFAAAQNNLGVMYQDGVGVPPDAAEAEKLYRLAAAQGLANAQSNLAVLHQWANGAPTEGDDELMLLRKAAARGDIVACRLLGTRYRNGDGVDKRIPLAAEMHVIAALESDTEAIASLAEYLPDIEAEARGGSLLASLCLAKMYDRGLAVERDQAKTLAWLLWADRCPTRADEVDVREEQIDMREFYALVFDDDIKNRAAQFFTAMMAAKAGISAAEASKPAPIADRTAQDAGTGFVMRMSGDAVEKTKPTGERATRKASGRVRDSLSGLGKRKGT